MSYRYMIADGPALTIELAESGDLQITVAEEQENGIVEASTLINVADGYSLFEGLWEWLKLHDLDWKLQN